MKYLMLKSPYSKSFFDLKRINIDKLGKTTIIINKQNEL